MALVDDQIEETRRILAVEAGALLIASDRLVDGEVHVAALDRRAGDLVPRVGERPEVLGHGVVHQHAAVRKEQDLGPADSARAVPARGPELPTDLEGDRGLAGARAEGEQDSPTPLQNGLGRPVDGDFLVVAKRPRGVGQRGSEQLPGDIVVSDAFRGAQATP